MKNPTPILLELFHFKTKEEKNVLIKYFFGIYRTIYNILGKKLCIQNNVLYTEPDGSTVFEFGRNFSFLIVWSPFFFFVFWSSFF